MTDTKAGPADGCPFAIDAGRRTSCARLDVATGGGAQIVFIDDQGVETPVACMGSKLWDLASEAVADDFGDRLEANGRDRGSMPSAGGSVYLHHSFGKELALLMEATHCYSVAARVLELWLAAEPTWRRDLALYITDETLVKWPEGVAGSCVPQMLEEALRLRSESGERDIDRENGVHIVRNGILNKIRHAQRRMGAEFHSRATWS